MNPIALAGLIGLAKGLVSGPGSVRRHNHLGSFLMAPLLEEATFRGPQMHPALSSAAFAAAHMTPQLMKADPSFSAYRFAEVFAGGLIYDAAFKRFGFLGAVGAHALHNVACSLGGALSPRGRFRR